MLKNISDYLSLMTLIFVSAYSVYVFLLLIVNREKDDTTTSRMQLLKDYLNNEEE
ncbi:MAG: hypothetical protein IJK53_02960 [Erysipelotrichaceae bacterium]|nr:hypothetical protein [Erysipelotrichaceae bacterium]MBQ6216323.1 hypothetical protein [Erysipelotrichaceae bacterium]MBR6233119.1 hypothetical protein [Erysipelotrichaceae bacterium]